MRRGKWGISRMVAEAMLVHGGAMTNQQLPNDLRFGHLPPPPTPHPGPSASMPYQPGVPFTLPPMPPSPLPRRRIELDVRNFVLGLGVVCLVASAVSFVAVNWDHFDASMRAALLIGATVASLGVSTLARRRSLAGTASALSWLTMVLMFIDLFALERAISAPVTTNAYHAVAGLVLLAAFVAIDQWQPDASMKTGIVVAWLFGSFSALGTWNVTGPDVWVLPVAAVVGWLQWTTASGKPEASSWERFGATGALVAIPAVLTALGDTHSLRPIIVIALGAVVLIAGVQFRQLAAVWLGGASVGVLVSAQLVDVLRGVPGWAVFALVGVALLVVGACFEQRLRLIGRGASSNASPAVADSDPVADPAPAWR